MKIISSGSRRYVQLVEFYRDDAGKVQKRAVATLGQLDQLDSHLNAVIQGLMKVSGQFCSQGIQDAIQARWA